jgi:DNA-directed RNA polymerase subunit beta
MTLSCSRVFFLAPYFVEMQRKSFLNLLNIGLIYELSKRNPISDLNKQFQLIFYPNYYQLSVPEYTPKQAILKSKTYASKLYLPLQLMNYKSKKFQFQWVIIGNLPLMTKRGHFIVNGSPRVIVNQMVRSPGIYYQQAIDQKKRKTYYADLISHRGAWLRIETDRKKRLWARMKKSPKIPLLIFLQAAGITEHAINQSTKYSEFIKNSMDETDDYPYPGTIKNALLLLYSIVYPRKKKSEITLGKAKKFLFRKFFNHRTYDLSQFGRIQLNKKFQFSVPETTYVLTPEDLLFVTDYLIQLEYGLGTIDDIDNLKNRRVRTSGELIQNQLGTGFIRLEKFIREKIRNSNLSISNIISTKPVNGALREFFGSSPLSQFMDQTNPLAELTHKRRVSSLGPGGVNRETAGINVRGIHGTHYGRVCPIETPEGRNAGLVNSLTVFARMNDQGFLETPFYSVYQGQIQKSCGVSFFSANQEQHIISAPGDLKIDDFSNLPSTSIPARVHGEFKKKFKNEIQYISVSPVQMISIATSLIPFLEHDDANRALMGSNMQRQAVPLILPEKTIVGTGLEARVTSDSGHGIQAKKSGFVSYVSGRIIRIENFYSRYNFKNTSSIKKKFSNTFKLTFDSETTETYVNAFQHSNICSLELIKKNTNFFPFSNKTKFYKKNKPFPKNYKTQGFNKQNKETKSKLFANQQYFSSVTKQENTKNSTQNFIYLSELIFSKKLSRFKKTLFTNTWAGFKTIKKISYIQYSGVFAPYFIQEKQFICSTLQSKKWKLALKQNLKKQYINDLNFKNFFSPKVSINLEFVNLLSKNKTFSTKTTNKTLYTINSSFNNTSTLFFDSIVQGKPKLEKVENKIILQNYNYTKFFQFKFIATNSNETKSDKISLKLIKINKEKKKKNIYFFSTCKQLAREKYISKIHFLGLSKKNLIKYLHVPKNVSFCNKNEVFITKQKENDVNSNRIIIKACTYLLYLKTFNNYKNIKNIFFYKSTAWDNFLNKKFSLIKSTTPWQGLVPAKLYKFSNVCPYILLNTPILDSSSNLRKINETFGINKKIQLKLTYSHENRFSFNSAFVGQNEVLSYRRLASLENIQNSPNSLRLNKISKSNLIFQQNCHPIKNFNFLLYDNFKVNSNCLHEHKNYFMQPYQHSNQNTCMHQRPIVNEGEWVQEGDLLADGAASVKGELSVGKTLLVAYMPWEGYNFEDAILISQRLIYDDLYTSIHIERYEIEISDTEYGLEQITSQIPDISYFQKKNLDTNGIIKLGSWVQEGDILVGKITPIKAKQLSGHERLLADILEQTKITTVRDTSLRVPKNVHGRVVHLELLEAENIPLEIAFQGPERVHIYIAEKRKIQVGDKMSGRHGNKGIVSKIIPQQDMPYLPDGSSVDMVLNPLGVPSRMNVGQIFECLLGLAGKELNEEFKISCFDEMNGPQASRSLTYSKLFQARLKTGKNWLFNPNSPGKIKLFDGRTGECFHQTVTVGQSYMLKLVHLVDEKIHARSTGPYSLVTQQPLRGRSKHGGQRLGEMEVWALEGFGAAYTLQELLTSKSDDIKGRHQVMQAILENKSITLGTPESFKVLLSELQSLCINIGVYSINNAGIRRKINIMQLS